MSTTPAEYSRESIGSITSNGDQDQFMVDCRIGGVPPICEAMFPS
jgi:hypothetical protein